MHHYYFCFVFRALFIGVFFAGLSAHVVFAEPRVPFALHPCSPDSFGLGLFNCPESGFHEHVLSGVPNGNNGPPQAHREKPDHRARYVSAYWAINSPDRFMDILTRYQPEFRSSYLVALAAGASVGRWRWIRFELEGQGVIHTGKQDHLEMNLVLVARWMDFPWDRWLDTRLAFGEGLSYATRTPHLEPRRDPDESSSARLLNYLMAELEFVIPGLPQWSKFIRVHHRSGAEGLFFGVRGGSNFIGTGIRYNF